MKGQRKQKPFYRTKYLPKHPRADVTGHVAIHILVMEKILGRSIEDGEVIHHKDFDRLNNGEDNLLLMTRQQHQQFPRYQALFLLEKGLYDEFLRWWEQKQDMTNPINKLEQQLLLAKQHAALLEEQNARIERKL